MMPSSFPLAVWRKIHSIPLLLVTIITSTMKVEDDSENDPWTICTIE